MTSLGKSPISALQEIMAARKHTLPVYVEEGLGAVFKCTVHAAGLKATGLGPNKKTAKHESAKNLLEQMGCLTKYCPTVVPLPLSQFSTPNSPNFSPTKNYVGNLNEFASQKSLSYANYEFLNVTSHNQFIMKCKFLDKETTGSGPNKKEAKQNAAKNMLQLLPNNMEKIQIEVAATKKLPNESLEKILNLYKHLSFEDSSRKTSTEIQDELKITANIDIGTEDTIDDLKEKISTLGICYKLKQMQKCPIIMSFTVDNTDLCFMAHGENKAQATKDVLLEVLKVATSGCSLKTNDDLINLS